MKKCNVSNHALPAFVRLYHSDFVHVLMDGKIVKSGGKEL
jgi:Fe-S cluster assembly ATPase SufC